MIINFETRKTMSPTNTIITPDMPTEQIVAPVVDITNMPIVGSKIITSPETLMEIEPADAELIHEKEVPGTGIGIDVSQCKTAADMMRTAGLNWNVSGVTPVCNGMEVPEYKFIVRNVDQKVLGCVTNKYSICQNNDAVAFTEELVGRYGIEYVRAGSFRGGKSIWVMAKMPGLDTVSGEDYEQYFVITNSHDGTGAVRMAIVPIRIACSNALNMAFKKATRTWSWRHSGDMAAKIDEAKNALELSQNYMLEFHKEIDRLRSISMNPTEVRKAIEKLLPYGKDATERMVRTTDERRLMLNDRFYHADDLAGVPDSAFKFINAVSDFATHCEPKRRTENYKENLFAKVANGHPLLDGAYKMFAA